MRNINNRIVFSASLFLVILWMSSCESYLDKAPESEITNEAIFGTFKSFQGFTEELYHTVPDYTRSTWVADWNMADEVLPTTVDWRLISHFDNGDYWYWYDTRCGWNQSYLAACNNTTNADWSQMGLWQLSWYGIRKANLGLENIDLLVEATQEEKDIIKGQLLFFRGFLHFQLMSFWGGLPYIDAVLGAEKVDLPRLSYRETALRAAEDLEAAAALLPVDWDKTEAGKPTIGNNFQRVTKSVALAYLGKDLLYAASPLMNKESTGSATYDAELCKKAADAFYQCLYLSHSGQAVYQLTEWERYIENFYTLNNSVPGYPESLLSPRFYWGGTGYDVQTSLWLPKVLGTDGNMVSPTHNYVKNYGMANGLPIDAEGSGYNPADPWSNRDPRFYAFIVYDSAKVVQGGDASVDNYRYANLYNGGNYRDDVTGSRTGYVMCKFITMQANNIDNVGQRFCLPSYMRLADVYLMYAEAVVQGYGTPDSKVTSQGGYELTAVDAVNAVRDRVQAGHVDARYLSSKEAFMSEIIRERAMEFLGEANIRFMDLRRWLLNDKMEYRQKTAIDFDRGSNGKPINMKERVVVTRVAEEKHYWLPLPNDQVNLYESFGQNPGW